MKPKVLKRMLVTALALPFLVVLVLLLTQMRWKFSKPGGVFPLVEQSNPAAQSITVSGPTTPAETGNPLLGVTILRDYANSNLSPQNDLTLMSRLFENSLLLLKSAADRPLSANEDWAGLLRGENAARERFLHGEHVAFNSTGQLVDRWKSPLFIHAVGGGRYDLRSAGPDRKLWTDDDIHRNADGSFRRGAELNPPSLFGEANRNTGR